MRIIRNDMAHLLPDYSDAVFCQDAVPAQEWNIFFRAVATSNLSNGSLCIKGRVAAEIAVSKLIFTGVRSKSCMTSGTNKDGSAASSIRPSLCSRAVSQPLAALSRSSFSGSSASCRTFSDSASGAEANHINVCVSSRYLTASGFVRPEVVYDFFRQGGA